MNPIRNPNTHKANMPTTREAIVSVAARAAGVISGPLQTPAWRIARLQELEAEVEALLELEREAGVVNGDEEAF